MASTVLSRARDSRTSPAVLKARVIAIRSRDANIWIFVYEGADDVGVYEEWIRAIDEQLAFEPVVGSGKDQVLGLRANLQKSQSSLHFRTLYFIDKDFDGLKGRVPGPDLFCTKRYSIENYVVCEEALRSILLDELRCANDGNDPGRAVEQFCLSYDDFLRTMREVNLRIFAARRSSIRLSAIEDRIHKYVDVNLTNSIIKFKQVDLETLVPAVPRQHIDITLPIETEFNNLDPRHGYRGKFAYGFFRSWVELLAQDRRAAGPRLFAQQSARTTFSANILTLRSLASRMKVPMELRAFIMRATQGTNERVFYTRLVQSLVAWFKSAILQMH